MEESGGSERESSEEISLLADELIQLSIKKSTVVPSDKPTLICTVWTMKVFNSESLRAQMKSIRKTKKKFEFQRILRVRINLDVQKPLRRGIFVSSEDKIRSWIPFKFEKLPLFCFGCGRLNHGIKDCWLLNPAEKEKVRDDPPYSIALKAESKVVGKESIKFNSFIRKVSLQRSYTGASVQQVGQEGVVDSIMEQGFFLGGKILASWEEGLMEQNDSGVGNELSIKAGGNNDGDNGMTELKKSTWKRGLPTIHMDHRAFATAGTKRKGLTVEFDQKHEDGAGAVDTKRLKSVAQSMILDEGAEIMILIQSIQNRRLTVCQLTGHNEKFELECSWVGEPMSSEKVATLN
ncbi:Endonuclease/exonuclease/phosphatase [Gossypium australe]|uniref:Endonuclease/exonuclease/phosphatase n=1 Tax=Gossypium australe TaxID=47621 RepID=A0A5B6VZ16_9ROSI|nr:Endonuclease/exonuclease/phosphatase [Gossypium australe]